ncbi:MAG TPA: phosphoribosylglycinamide formyltransferase, partial [Flavobacteriaceae bacterium]|nr:phosphoribosylglycinamide formyltransferase [Flavobacteriaceae bacterium]
MIRIVIFASGSGTNAENIMKYFKNNDVATVVRVLSNNKDAKVLERANKLNVNNSYFDKSDFFDTESILNLLKEEADIISLAGFLWKIRR